MLYAIPQCMVRQVLESPFLLTKHTGEPNDNRENFVAMCRILYLQSLLNY
jgi:hypothetical protein